MPELTFILLLALLIFGPKRLPSIGKTLGKAIGEFRRATSELARSIEVEANEANRPAPATTAATPRAAAETGATESEAPAPDLETVTVKKPEEGEAAAQPEVVTAEVAAASDKTT